MLIPHAALLHVPATKDLITNHTSATSASGTASASSENGTRSAWKAFDGGVTGASVDAWNTNSVTSGWLQYQFSAARCLKRYTIVATPADDGVNANRAPKTWTMLGSNTGAFAGEEVTLDTQTNVAVWTATELRTYDITNKTKYLYYRLNVTANQGGALVEVAEMRLLGY